MPKLFEPQNIPLLIWCVENNIQVHKEKCDYTLCRNPYVYPQGFWGSTLEKAVKMAML